MNIREILQIEIWSKNTSRKIFVVSAACIVLGFGIWYAVERYWVTPGMRKLGGIALAQIDALQAPTALNDADFEVAANRAEQEINAADREAWTDRDIGVMFQLTDYLASARLRRRELLNNRSNGKQDSRTTLSQGWTAKLLASEVRLRSELHKALD